MTIEDVYRYMISGYFGVMEMDSYKLKEYVLNDIKNYIKEYMKDNPSENFNLDEEAENIKNNVPVKTKLQDALLVLNKMDNAPMDLILDIKHRLKTIK